MLPHPVNHQASGAVQPEFDLYADNYSAGMENPLKRLAGTDAEVFIELKAWLLLESLRRQPLDCGAGQPRLLDFGCGDGVLLRLLAKEGFNGSLFGSDVSSGMLQSARDRWQATAATLPPEAKEPAWSISMPGQLPYSSQTFDIVTCLGVFHHIPPEDRDADWAEIARVTRPGGRCYVFEHNPYNPLTQWVVRHTAIDKSAVLLTPSETARSLRKHGFAIHQSHGLMYWPPRWRRLWAAERLVQWIPLGGQFVVIGERL